MAPSAVISLNGPDRSHLGPLPTPSAQFSQKPHFSASWGLQDLLELCCSNTGLYVSGPVHPGPNPWVDF